MDLTLSGEQVMIKESVERFVAERDGGDAWPLFADLGWLALGVPAEAGGFGGPIERMILMESFGRGLVREPYATGAVLAGSLLAATGRHDLLARLVDGSERFAVAYEEAEGGYDPAAATTSARPSAGGYRLTGAKTRVVTPAGPARVLVSARLDGAHAVFAVPPGAAGVSRSDFATEDGRQAARVTFDDVALGADALIAPAQTEPTALVGALDHATGAICAEAVGIMSVLMDTTLRYLKERSQFGVTIGSFQALQHRMADMYVELELARSMAYVAAMVLEGDREPRPRSRAISAAKVQIARSGRFIGQNAIQLHGAIAMAEEYAVGGYFKRLTTLERLFGDADYHVARYVRLS
jgi:alkylation response protein AidB-like acyl-CoA dehydrogenase